MMIPQLNSSPVNVQNLSGLGRAELLKSTLFVEDIDNLQTFFGHALNRQPEMRLAFYEVARQNARYRLSLAADKALLAQLDILAIDDLHFGDWLELLNETNDTRVVDRIEVLTVYRLKKLPEFRKELFNIARQGVKYRLAARQQAEPVNQ